MFKDVYPNPLPAQPQSESSPRHFAGFGNRLAAERQASIVALERCTRRAKKTFEPSDAIELAEIVLGWLGVEVGPEMALRESRSLEGHARHARQLLSPLAGLVPPSTLNTVEFALTWALAGMAAPSTEPSRGQR